MGSDQMLPLSDHAKFEMRRRGITEDEVGVTFHQPQQKIKLEGGREIWQNKVEAEGKAYVIRVILEVDPRTRIITVYKSSKVKKYWRIES